MCSRNAFKFGLGGRYGAISCEGFDPNLREAKKKSRVIESTLNVGNIMIEIIDLIPQDKEKAFELLVAYTNNNVLTKEQGEMILQKMI